MNSRLIFNEFAKLAQSNDKYYTWGEPSQIGIIEDLLSYFGLDYKISPHSSSMHREGLEKLQNFLIHQASDEQLMLVHKICTENIAVPTNNPALPSSDRVFVSMPMNKEKCTDVDIIREGIKRGIEQTGNSPYFLDLDSHNSNITVKMLEEIQSCKFLVADFTTHNTGVYYEAGYATALGKTVIHTCKKSDFDNLHFDIKQTQTLAWTDAENLSKILTDQIVNADLEAHNV